MCLILLGQESLMLTMLFEFAMGGVARAGASPMGFQRNLNVCLILLWYSRLDVHWNDDPILQIIGLFCTHRVGAHMMLIHPY